MAYSTPLLVRKAVFSRDWDVDPAPDPDNPTNTCADMSDEQLNDAIRDADSTIDSYIGRWYKVPVGLNAGAVPHPIDYWSRNIAAYDATLTFRGSQDFTDDDPIARRYIQTMLALTAVRDGKATLQIPEVGGDTPGAVSGAGRPHNPYTGDLFGAEDFDLAPVGDSRLYGRPRWWDGHW